VKISDNALTVLERRYLRREGDQVLETPEQMLRRVADNIAQVEIDYYGATAKEAAAWANRYHDLMDSLDFLPNSPTLMNAGRELQQLAACFVLPIEDSMESIFDTLKHAALIHKSGGGTGFSFSRLRPKNDQVRSTGGVASGPISFLKVFNAATEAVKQGGTRRGANMGILRVDHPDIVEFISCKVDSREITNFNISVGLTETFMEAVRADTEYPLLNPRDGTVCGHLRAREVLDLVVDHAWRNGEPGIIFLDRLERDNPTPTLGRIESTNPCGEQPLLPYEACNLGSINLSRMVVAEGQGTQIDWDRLRQVVHLSVRFLDDVIDACVYPLDLITAMVKGNRKIGLGIMGFADLLIQLGVAYNSEEAVQTAQSLMRFIQTEARSASAQLAAERGPFPNFAVSIYADGAPLRHATTTTIAPTGTISLIAGASSGIEPLFALSFVRNVLDGARLVEVHPLFKRIATERGFYSAELAEKIARTGSLVGIEGIPADIQGVFVTAHDISPEWHIRIQAAFQDYTDNAVSKTVNFPHDATREDVAKVYSLAYELGAKGVTIYRDGSRDDQVLQVQRDGDQASATEAEPARAVAVPVAATPQHTVGREPKTRADQAIRAAASSSGAISSSGGATAASAASAERALYRSAHDDGHSDGHEDSASGLWPRPRLEESETNGITKKFRIGGCGKLFVTVNADDEGICEVFTNTGEEGCPSLSAALSRVISISLRAGVAIDAIIDQLKGIRCIGCIIDPDTKVLSCPDAIGKAIEKFVNGHNRFDLNVLAGPRTVMVCPEPGCGGLMVPDSGCYTCTLCGYSKCG
jgi:ribonucleoside-diphosphate reductase alpha chain